MSIQNWFRENANGFSGQILFNEPLAKHTYYRIGGPAEVYAVPKSQADVQWLAGGIQETQCRYFVLGQGSNLLASDQGFSGLIVRANRLNLELEARESEAGTLRVRTGASVVISSLLRRAAQEGWAGFEFLTGIPGAIGGAVFMNAGTHLGEVQSRIRRVEVLSLKEPLQKVSVYEGETLRFQYRKNLFLPPGSLVWAAEWEVSSGAPLEVKTKIDETLARRKATQPIDYPSCGSVFKNPKSSGYSAWQVVDQLGLRGHRIGDAQFAEKHSNFIINLGTATAADVKALIHLAKTRAENELNIHLEEEVIYLE